VDRRKVEENVRRDKWTGGKWKKTSGEISGQEESGRKRQEG